MNMIGALRMFRKKDGIDDRFCDPPVSWVCDGAVPAGGGVNPAPTIWVVALRTADWTGDLARRCTL